MKLSTFHLLCGLGVAFFLGACARQESESTADGRVKVRYWEKWTDFEGRAMQSVVDDFNQSQNRIFVEVLTVSDIDQKMLLATAGGHPPDVAGLYAGSVQTYAEKGALTPLDSMLRQVGIRAEQYIPVYWKQCGHRGFQWALPSAPASLALHWNKKMFREAGLDPNRPPRTLDELDAIAEKLTLVNVIRYGKSQRVRFSDLTPEEKMHGKFDLVQLGFVPMEPGWWNSRWGSWFGGRLWDGNRRITATDLGNLQALEWIQSYPKKYGLDRLRSFGASFGSFNSPQNAFLSEKVAMVLQGVWMYNFISKYAPHLEWGAAPFPSKDPRTIPMVTLAECDVLVIPHGAKHPKEAFEFIRYVNTRPAMEKLCLGQLKFSPLAETSPDFVRKHPHPYLQVFIDLAKSPNAFSPPHVTIWNQYTQEMTVAVDRVFGGLITPREALEEVQQRMQRKYDRQLTRWDLVKNERLKEWRRNP